MAEYKLSASLVGHDDDVRAVTFPIPEAAISASRDGTVRIWKRVSNTPPVFSGSISSSASAFVNTIAYYLPPDKDFEKGVIVSGGQDALVELREPAKGPQENAKALLFGHASNICALDVDPGHQGEAAKFVVSGSWDSEAKLWSWEKTEAVSTFKGHKGSVWAVLAYDSQTIITGCADKKIRVFNINGNLIRTIEGSQDVVRALCRVPKLHPSQAAFASASNDGIIRLWTIEGHEVGRMIGHESFIYSLASSPSGELFSAGEDRTVRVWKGVDCVQTITHPAISVWSVAVCPDNGDIITGASDKIVRIFSRDPERFADADTTRQFENSVKESSIPQAALGDVPNKEKLPGPEFLTQKSGTKEGQVQMIRESNGSITAHQWSVGQQQWLSIGTVVDSVGSGKKVDYQGKEYDFVFDVDIEDGKPALKLPYNLSQNPYEAATKFIQNNELPVTYLDQVADFITSNTQGATIGQSAPEQPSAPDPWGSDNRYRPGGDSVPAPYVPPKILPQKEYLSILVTRIPAVQKKIVEINQGFVDGGKKDISLNPENLATLASLCKQVESNGAVKASQSVAGGLDLVIKMATTWPYGDRLPALDLLRLLAVAPETAKWRHPQRASIIEVLQVGSTEDSPVNENMIMMALRGYVNIFATAEGRNLAVSEFQTIIGLINTCITTTTNRNLLVAASTICINYAVYFKSVTASIPLFDHVIAIIELAKILIPQSDSEVVYRTLVGLGTLLTVNDETREAAKLIYSMAPVVRKAATVASDPRIKNVGKEISELLA